MVKAFQFSSLPIIHFKCGKLAELPGIIQQFGKTILLISGKESTVRIGAVAGMLESLGKQGIKYHQVIVPFEPTPKIIDNAVREFNQYEINAVIGIGGGSVLDAGKAISAMMYKPGSVKDFLEGVGHKDHPGTKLPYIAVPTTAGTGSEATKNAVISETGENGFKKSLRHDRLVPDIAIVDPELTLGCPPEITAASGMDCFTQLLESYLSPKSSNYTDALAYEGLGVLSSSLQKAFRDPGDIGARTGMSFAALTSGICLANAGLGVIHGFASSLGGLYPFPHGALCGTLMAASNKLMVEKLRSERSKPEVLMKYARVGKLFLQEEGKTEDYYIDGFIEKLYEFTEEFSLPGLKKYGVEEIKLQTVAASTEMKNNPVNLTEDELMEILRERYF